jgi:heptosyltransferase-2
VIGISPGAAYGDAKRWLPERFAESGQQLAGALGASVLVFGAAAERPLCETVAEALRRDGIDARNLAGETSLPQFIDLAAACRLFLTNDSGAMHVASALGVPTVAVFGATDDTTTGPTGEGARVVREPVECSPCLLRQCPIDHRCMTRVTAAGVTAAASRLLGLTE